MARGIEKAFIGQIQCAIFSLKLFSKFYVERGTGCDASLIKTVQFNKQLLRFASFPLPIYSYRVFHSNLILIIKQTLTL